MRNLEPGISGNRRAAGGGVFASVILAIAALLGAPAWAQSQQFLDSHAENNWKLEDACVAESIKRYPNQDLLSLRHRDSYVDTCSEAHGVPARAHLAPDP